MNEAPALVVDGIDVAYGRTRVLRGVSLEVGRGDVVCVMGRNGAGKTTLLRALMGVLPTQSGRLHAFGRDVTGWKGHRLGRLGLSWVPQDDSMFSGLTVREHLTIASGNGDSAGTVTRAAAMFPALQERFDQEAQTLSGGERKMLAIAQAVGMSPRLLFLDEPTEGLAPVVIAELLPVLAELAQTSSLLVVEQNIDTARALCRRAYVLEKGSVIEHGDMAELHDSGILHERLGL